MSEIYNIKKELEKEINNFISTEIEWIPLNSVEISKEKNDDLIDFFDGKNMLTPTYIDTRKEFFQAVPSIREKMDALMRVGLGYIKVGQQATTLSGGEAQRVKLSKELSKRSTGRTLYILDEPTTGLSFYDVHKLMDVMQRLVDKGNSIICIEHNLDVIRCSDWLIDLGPEGGDKGGQIVACGTPEEVAQHPTSHTGRYLAKVLEQHPPEVDVPLAA